ncbi:hypothetical protein [Saprospira grandis]|uniref:hypothetical protein n=1 Tax=Saprospira grandis TaxID=1008 RepID=UPI0022DE9521|nr:hypothetical protein [Saprospira grandis]WBM74743.1 hypothetical protein OP864_00610 [Saprospira grandis]
MENVTVEDLRDVEFHDATFSNFTIDFRNKWIEVEVESCCDRPKLVIQFSKVKNISVDDEIEEWDDCQIGDVDFKPIPSTERIEVTITLIMVPRCACPELKFSFSDLKVRFTHGVKTLDELNQIWSED